MNKSTITIADLGNACMVIAYLTREAIIFTAEVDDYGHTTITLTGGY